MYLIALLLVVFFPFILTRGLSRVRSLLPEMANQEHFIESTPIIRDIPSKNIKDSHWFIKTFLRPKRKYA